MITSAAEAAIFQLLVENGLNPAFSLEVTEFNSQRVVIGGAVLSPLVIPINSRPVTLDLAITAAGGLQITDPSFASIRIFRDGTLYQIPVEDFLARPDLQTTRLQNGDAIYVDVTYDLDRALQYFRQQLDVISLRAQSASDALAALSAEVGMRRAELQESRSNFRSRLELDAEDRDYVYLTGEVDTNGRLPLPFNRQATLADVLFESGGFLEETGNPAQIYVLRPSPHAEEFGAVTAWHLDARNPAAMTLATRMEMRPNDIVFIDAQVITTWNRALRQFFPVFVNTALARGLN